MSVKPTILVTGGAGYIGSHTARFVADKGYKVVVLDNLIYGHRSAVVDADTELVEGSVGDAELLEKLFLEHKFAAVVHFAAFTAVGESVAEPLKYYRNNTMEPLILLEVMKKHDCKVIVFSSTAAVYGEPQKVPIEESHPKNPLSPYGRSKYFMECIFEDCDRAWGLKSACLRYFNASGASADGEIGEDHVPETHLIPLVLMAVTGERKNITIFGTDYDTPDGTCIRDYIHVEDLASAHHRALDYLLDGGDSVRANLGTGKGISVMEIVKAVEEVTGKEVPVVNGERRAGDPGLLIADPSTAKNLLGWEAEHKDVKDMVSTAWQWINGPKKGRFGD